MMNRRRFFNSLGVAALSAPLVAEAQQAGKLYQVGFVTLGPQPMKGGLWQSFIEAMRELNYVEGRNLLARLAIAEGNTDRMRDLIADLVQAKVDVIVTTSSQETLAVKRATSTIPIVMTLAPDPVEQGLVASLARPGGNVTGLTSQVPAISQKLVELLREAVPLASRFAVLGSTFPAIRRELQAAAQQLGITLSFTSINGPDDLDPALARAKKDGAGGIIVALDVVTLRHRAKLVPLALKHRLPGIYWVREYVEAGGLMSYGVSFGAVGRRAAYFVDRLLKGAKPADLPVEYPTTFELVINLKTAKALGLTIPPSLLLRADQVME
jgi:putative ABC transport system substrate-binding protein